MNDAVLPSITIAQVPVDSGEAVACVAAYYRELDVRFDGGFDPGSGGYAKPSSDDDNEVFLLARMGVQPIGCGMVHLLDADTAEIKRMWLAPEARGRGLSKRLLAELERHAGLLGASRIRLDTNATLGEAQALYRKAGYREIARYNDNLYAQMWFEKAIG